LRKGGSEMSDLSGKVCETCLHYASGQCYRYPPVGMDGGKAVWFGRPMVDPKTRACGEWNHGRPLGYDGQPLPVPKGEA